MEITEAPPTTVELLPKTSSPVTLEGLELARACVAAAEEKKAEECLIMDVRGLTTISDYFVICTGNSSPHLRSIRDEIVDQLRTEHQLRLRRSDGNTESQWLILDFGDVMVHIFHGEKRKFYALEDLWSDAARVE